MEKKKKARTGEACCMIGKIETRIAFAIQFTDEPYPCPAPRAPGENNSLRYTQTTVP